MFIAGLLLSLLSLNLKDMSKINTLEEIWNPVVGYEGLYEVSDKGRIKALSRIVKYNRWGGASEKRLGEKFLNPTISKCGYYHTTLSLNSKKETVLIHRIIAIAFLPNQNNLPQVNHKDGNKLNNAVENLEWVTASANHIHAASIGLKGKFSNDKVALVREEYAKGGINQKALSAKHGISYLYLNKIINNKARC